MTKLHELLAAEKTPNSSWHVVLDETIKKFKNPAQYFQGMSKTLKMIEETPANKETEDAAREEKPVVTTVFETLDYAFDIWKTAEDLQYQKNKTNQKATGTILWDDQPLIESLPVDELLGLEFRLSKIKELILAIPTIDSSKSWIKSATEGNLFVTKFPEETTKTEKQIIPVIMVQATDKHPAQVQATTKDSVVGKFTTIKKSGEITALQKANMIKIIDKLIIEVKQARMRANDAEAEKGQIAQKIIDLLLEPLKI